MGEAKHCTGCGGPLPEAFDTNAIACTYCNRVQPNPQPLPEGQEVLLRGDEFGSRLGRVVSCQGPDRIELEIEDRREVHRLEDLTPVASMSSVARKGDRVFVSAGSQWQPTWLVRADGDICVVKHEHPEFQGSFFDKQLSTNAVRLPLRKQDRVRQRRVLSWTNGPPFVVIAAVVGIAYVALRLLVGC